MIRALTSFASYHHIILHNIATYIIHHFASTEEAEKEGKLLLRTYQLTHEVKSIFGKESRKNVSIIQELCLGQRCFYIGFVPSTTVLSAFRDRGVPKPTSECRCVPQPRWVERVGEREGGSEVAGDGRERGGNPAAFVFVPRPGRVRLQ
jgi:hypothetical protein